MSDLTPETLADLRRTAEKLAGVGVPTITLDLLDRIEALEAERDAARAEADQYRDDWHQAARRVLRLEPENELLRAALERAQPWLDYLATNITPDWSPPEQAVMQRDAEFVRSLPAPEDDTRIELDDVIADLGITADEIEAADE